MADVILVLNAGSSSIKFSAFDAGSAELALLVRGQVEGLYTAPRFVAKDAQGAEIGSQAWDKGVELGHAGAVNHLVEFLRERRARPPAGGRRPPGRARRRGVHAGRAGHPQGDLARSRS